MNIKQGMLVHELCFPFRFQEVGGNRNSEHGNEIPHVAVRIRAWPAIICRVSQRVHFPYTACLSPSPSNRNRPANDADYKFNVICRSISISNTDSANLSSLTSSFARSALSSCVVRQACQMPSSVIFSTRVVDSL